MSVINSFFKALFVLTALFLVSCTSSNNLEFPSIDDLTQKSWSDNFYQNAQLPNLDGNFIQYTLESDTFIGYVEFSGSGYTELNDEAYTNLDITSWGKVRDYKEADWQELPKITGKTMKISSTSGNVAEGNKILNYQEMESTILPTYAWMLAISDSNNNFKLNNFKWKRSIEQNYGELNIKRDMYYEAIAKEKFKSREVFVVQMFSIDPVQNKIVEKKEYFIDTETRLILKSKNFNSENKLVSEMEIVHSSFFEPGN